MFPVDRATNLVIIAMVWTTLIVWQLFTARSETLPSFASVVGLMRRSWLVRWMVLLGWAWLGWHLFVRTHY